MIFVGNICTLKSNIQSITLSLIALATPKPRKSLQFKLTLFNDLQSQIFATHSTEAYTAHHQTI